MAHSLERRWARLVKAYSRLKNLYERALQRESILVDELRDARAEVRGLRRDAQQLDRASRKSFEHLLATTRYAIAHLYEANDFVAAEKLEGWIEVMEDTMQPVANVQHLIDLLQEWCDRMPCDDVDKVSATWMKTKSVLDAARGTDGTSANE